MPRAHYLSACFLVAIATCASSAKAELPGDFLHQHCVQCHNADTQEGNLDLSSLKVELQSGENFARWVKIHDRIASGEMPPQDQPRPKEEEISEVTSWLKTSLIQAEQVKFEGQSRTGVRRLTRAEYENTIRDLFDLPGIALQSDLPADGSAHGFDKNSDALDISHVNLAKYMEAADKVLDMAIATQPGPPTPHKQRVSLASHYYVRLLATGNGGAVLLKDKKPDPSFLPTAEQQHIDQGAHERLGLFDSGSSVGVFRHEDESFHPWFQAFAAIYPGRYRIRTSVWSYQWDKGEVMPSRGVEAVRLSVMQLTGNGRGQDHPSYVIGYYDAPSIESQVHEFTHWLNEHETIGFNVASLAPVHIYHQYKRNVMSFTGPGIACDWAEIEGPLHDVWPPRSHKVLFGDLPLKEFKRGENPDVHFPQRTPPRQIMLATKNKPDPYQGDWSVQSETPPADARKLLANFLPQAFRRPVAEEVVNAYVSLVETRLQAGDCFELAMRWAYRAALCSPDFLYHLEEVASGDQPKEAKHAALIDDYALASRLSYFFWNSRPDDRLGQLAAENKLHEPEVLRAEVERLLRDPKSERFIEDFLGQWLKLKQIAANDPDRKLYPEFSPYLQDSMVMETKAYFRELLEKNLDASYLVKSDFAMLNEKLAVHYGIEGVSGPQIRRVELPADCPRGPFLTQAAILKITANGTTTSPVPRGAFVLDRLLGKPPEPPPANVAAVEPDVRGATTIREQLAKHRNHAVCASCHAKMDPPGFALEAFDVIGGERERYRSIGEGDPAPRGSIDPFIGISFKLGLPVDASGQLSDGRSFEDVRQFQSLIAADKHLLLKSLAERLSIYATGREVSFSDREPLGEVIALTEQQGGGIRTLIQQLVQSPLMRMK